MELYKVSEHGIICDRKSSIHTVSDGSSSVYTVTEGTVSRWYMMDRTVSTGVSDGGGIARVLFPVCSSQVA